MRVRVGITLPLTTTWKVVVPGPHRESDSFLSRHFAQELGFRVSTCKMAVPVHGGEGEGDGDPYDLTLTLT